MQSSSTAATTGHAGQLESTSTILCRLIILRYSNSEALMIEQGGRHAIPSVDIPRWQRAAPHIVPAVLSRCNVLAICRFAVGVQNPEHECHYFVLDAVDSSQPATGGTVWVPVGNIAWADSESRIGQEAFYEALRQARSYDMAEPPVPFTKSRWFGE